MQPQDSVDVTFCDLCNTSVPLQDLERGAAVRHQGKTVGACCLGALRAAPAAGAAPAVPAGPRPDRGDSRLLPLGIAVLAAIAAATIFVDSRIQNLEERSMRKLAEFDDAMKGQHDVVTKVSADLDGVARRSDFDNLGERFAAIDAAGGKLADQMRTQSEELARANAKVLERVAEADQHRPDYAPTLDELKRQLQQQGVVLAELRAQPHAPPAAAQPDKPADAPPPDNGLPAALAHEVQKLKDEDPAARFIAVDALLRSKNAAVVEHLLPMAKDNDVLVRRLVVDGLKDFKQAAVVDVLLVALADPADIVADTAWRSLKDMTGQKMPFDAKGSREERNRAQKAWREWWDKNRNGFGS
jgi:hypothetical protein